MLIIPAFIRKLEVEQSKGEFTSILEAYTSGDGGMLDQLFPVIYRELHDMADRHMSRERGGHTLSATALIHEAYLKLIDQDAPWQNRAHFLGVASTAMKRILINYAEARRAKKRGGGEVIATFDEQYHQREARSDELLALNDALKKLRQVDPRQAQIVDYWFFGGLTHEEIAEVLKVSVPTVRRDWRIARAWLSIQLKGTNIVDFGNDGP